MRCIVLCAGFATRLYPLTLHRPKQLLTVGNRYVIDFIMMQLADAGIQNAVVVSNHRFADQFKHWRRQSNPPVKVEIFDNGVSKASQRLGAVGDLHLVLDALDVRDDFLVVHGDNLFTFPLGPILNAFAQQGNILATYDVKNMHLAKNGGQITCDTQGRIIDLVEKPRHPKSSRISIGIYALAGTVRNHIVRYLSKKLPPDRTGDFMAWLHKQVALFTYPVARQDGLWFDMGTHETYQKALAAVAKINLRTDNPSEKD